jgi:hypothetical protein
MNTKKCGLSCVERDLVPDIVLEVVVADCKKKVARGVSFGWRMVKRLDKCDDEGE